MLYTTQRGDIDVYVYEMYMMQWFDESNICWDVT